ncbi:MetQ/NlpA family ABC transporter substrate-binding protein [Megasphaera sp. DJF_B143]|uniref:MetQ/NlpA family ABC transporter substrate-binding protein n=1 Tax=Megasphaera sp. DJF_B143 TaxID=537288 RepID=UPI0012433C96|nr:MetQ/NlpA family ABC transporter substrate-binding protein [Megasphaera sp. DJF_B143]
MKSFIKKAVTLAALATLCVFAAGCGSSDNSSKSASSDKKEITVGVTPGIHAEIMEQVKKEAAKQGITIKIMEFSDYVTPDVALSNKEIDMNSYQHKPYMDNLVKDKGLKIVSIGQTVVAPIGLYSHKIKSLDDVKDGMTVAVRNDPTNGARGLLLLQKAGFIKIKDGVKYPTPQDITENAKHLQIKELEAAQIPRSLDDVDFAAINTNYAMDAGLNPVTDALLREDKDSPYANILAVHEDDKDNPTLKKIVEIYNSDVIRKYIEEHYKGALIPAF